MRIVICPSAGMCNRFRMLSSYISYGMRMGCEIYICWDVVPKSVERFTEQQEYMRMQDRKYSDFFEESFPEANVDIIPTLNLIYTEWLPIDKWYKYQSAGQKKWISNGSKAKLVKFAHSLPQFDDNFTILIETSLELKTFINKNGDIEYISDDDMHKVYSTNLIPKLKYLNYINTIKDIDIGLSIRGGEFLNYFPETKYIFSPGNMAIIHWLNEIIHTKTTLIIFSDDHFYRDTLNLQLKGVQNLELITLERNTFQDWEYAFIEFLILALKTKIIYGTPHSSFPKQASIYGNIPHKNLFE